LQSGSCRRIIEEEIARSNSLMGVSLPGAPKATVTQKGVWGRLKKVVSDTLCPHNQSRK